MRTRDNVRLDADVWRPEADGLFPVLLMRQPYGRTIASTAVYAHPSWYARRGYIVVIQDVRGRGTSEGDFRIFEAEVADGEDALDWASKISGSTGKVGMYGFSYHGMTQLFAAASRHLALATICPGMSAWDTYSDLAYEGGAFRLDASLGWALQLSVEAARRAGDVDAHQALFAASQALPLSEKIPAYPEVMQRHGHYGYFPEWVTRSAPDAYWDRISPKTLLRDAQIPMLHIGSWYDGMLTGTLACFRQFAAQAGAPPQHLAVGPWAHLPWTTRVGAVDFGPAAANMIDHLQLRWFDHWLKGIDTGLLGGAPVRLFEMGRGWRDFRAWPDAPKTSFYLTSAGRAGLDAADGKLGERLGADGEDVVVFDPRRPTPSAGGHKAYPLGPADRRALDMRNDVLTFTSAPLDRDLHLAGDVEAELFLSSESRCFDVSVVLSEAWPDGRVINLTEGYLRCEARASPLKIPMRSTCARIATGSAIRLSVAAGSFPAHPVNNGDSSPPASARLIDQTAIALMLRHGGAAPSRLLLPVVAGQ